MASTGLNFANLTPDNGAVRDLKALIFESIVSPEKLGNVFNIIPKQYDGDKLGFIGEFGLVGKAGSGCDPTYDTNTIGTTEKTWAIKRWEVAKSLCFADLESTLVKYVLKNHTEVSDLTANEYLSQIVQPRLETAIQKALFRIAWFGDTAAKATADGGVVLNSDYVPFFNITDGLFKQIYTIVAANANRHVDVAANAETTFAAQKTAMYTSGVPTSIVDGLIQGASVKLRGASNGVIFITYALKDALDWDLKKNNYGSELQWQSLFNGIQETSYNGITLRAIPEFDEIIQSYEGSATAWNKPYRAVYTTQDNLLLGLTSDSEVDTIDISFDHKDRKNYIYATDKVGALVAQDDLIEVAY